MQQRKAILEALEGGTSSAWTIHIGLEHERLHQETLCYMLAQQEKQNWQAVHLKEDGGVLENGAAFAETLARVRFCYLFICKFVHLLTVSSL